MVLILLSIIFAAIAVAISMIRQYISFGSLARSGIANEDIADDNAQSNRGLPGPMKQFLIVVLPDGTIVTPRVAGQM
jgi:hypothetical protein